MTLPDFIALWQAQPFRPFAPSILEERVGDYFEQTHPAPTMLMVYQIKPERRGVWASVVAYF